MFKRELSSRKRLYIKDYRAPRLTTYRTPFTAMLTQLCDTCRQFAVGESEGSQYEKHHRTIAAFYEAKTYGCFICTRLWARVYPEGCSVPPIDEIFDIICLFETTSDVEGEEKIYGWRFRIYTHEQPTGFIVVFDMLKDETGRYDGVCEPIALNTFTTQGHEQILKNINHEICTSTDSVFTINIAQYWLSNCQAYHPRCQRDADLQHPLPQRVIDVGTIGESSVRLFVSDSSVEYGSYITLSHCWGNSDIMKLTVENEATLRAGFTIQDLPKTFRQAIQFTRALSVRYLWIDSLCILQNSIEDWRHQSAVMGEIYKHCFCNIAATSSSNSDGGIFVEREPSLLKPLNLTIKWQSHHGGPARQGRFYLWDSGLWNHNVRDSPLNCRAWVLQERLLAPRVLHFGKYLFWECKSMAASEIMPTGKPRQDSCGYETFYPMLVRIIEQLSTKADEPTYDKKALTKSAYNAWWDLVKKYSSCQLTKDEDILVAISGIASLMGKALMDQYVGGLWRSTLLEDLLWRPYAMRSPRPTRPFPFRAPTWSWASMKGQVFRANDSIPDTFYDRACVFFAEIMDVRIESAGAERNGQLKNGYLSVLGSTFDMACQETDFHEDELSFKIGHYTFGVDMYMDDFDWWEVFKERRGTDVVCMPILLTSDGDISIHGLVIEAAPYGYPDGHFVRIGVFICELQAENQPDIEEFKLKFEERENRRTIVLV